MAAPVKNIRFPEPLIAAIETAAARHERTFSAEVLATLAERYMGEDSAAPVAPKAQAKRKAAPGDPASVPGVVKASELSERGVSMRAAMERAGVAEYDPSAKRPQYQRKAPGAGKGRR